MDDLDFPEMEPEAVARLAIRNVPSVTIIDDTLRRNRAELDSLTGWQLMKDRHGKQIQDVIRVAKVLEGAHLEHAVKRARRWMSKPGRGGAPRHIALFMAAFHKWDQKGFAEAAQSAVA